MVKLTKEYIQYINCDEIIIRSFNSTSSMARPIRAAQSPQHISNFCRANFYSVIFYLSAGHLSWNFIVFVFEDWDQNVADFDQQWFWKSSNYWWTQTAGHVPCWILSAHQARKNKKLTQRFFQQKPSLGAKFLAELVNRGPNVLQKLKRGRCVAESGPISNVMK